MKKVYTNLPTTVIPSHYSLVFEPNFTTFTYKGEAAIEIDIPHPTKLIALHAKELTVHKAILLLEKDSLAAKIKFKESEQELHLTFPKPIKGKATLKISFTGIHNEQMYGFYRSKYTLNGKEEYLLSTQFEAPNARAAFPCFDEPVFKATFDVTLIVDKDLVTLSNMPIKQQTPVLNNKKKVLFHTTPRMSTYLLYLGVGNFKYISTKYNNITINVYTTPDKIQYALLPLNYTKTFLAYFEKYFDVPYPLPKVDMIAIPDFAAGAMENWGAITFREIALLGDEKTSVVIKQNIAITIAHELAHQWFGNLVTMEWWNDLWLNESFATFMSYKAVHDAFPEWDLPLQYFENTITSAMSADQVESTHPINVVVKTPGEIDEIFDRISYDKGGSVLHMLEDFVGEDNFQKGLSQYLKKFAYKNATKDDLWNAIAQVYKNKLVVPVVEQQITLPGYPVVRVSKDKKGYILCQERFTLLPRKYPQQWLLPITYTASDGTVKKIVLQNKKMVLSESSSWIKLNYHQHGFYRVKYDGALLPFLGEAIASTKISALDAVGIENDLFAFMVAGEYSASEYLSFIEKYCLHAQYPLDVNVSGHLGWLFQAGYTQSFGADVRRVSSSFHRGMLGKVGWVRQKDEKNTRTILRSMCLASLGMLNHPDTLHKTAQWLEQIKSKSAEVDVNLRGVIYLLAAWKGTQETYSYLLNRYKTEKIPEESRKLLRALGMFQDKNVLAKALDLSQTSDVRLQDSYMIPVSISMNPAADVKQLWSWTKKNWKGLQKKFTPGSHMLGTYVHNFDGMNTNALRNDFKTFFEKKENIRDDVKQAVKQVLEKSLIMIKFVERNRK
ncbi:MAG: M1 family metallopeptidase [Nanoarchaeota archaeon]|nr:M1 family metallopeptidase [Nanoarchaeota archaeon]